MDKRHEIMQIARRWVGTPYQHQARVEGVGVDCVNFVLAVGIEAGVIADDPEKFAPFSGYARVPNPRHMVAGMDSHFKKLPGLNISLPGDIVWLAWRKDLPMHVALLGAVGERVTLIHAYSGTGKVVEHGLDKIWLDRIHSVYRFPEL